METKLLARIEVENSGDLTKVYRLFNASNEQVGVLKVCGYSHPVYTVEVFFVAKDFRLKGYDEKMLDTAIDFAKCNHFSLRFNKWDNDLESLLINKGFELKFFDLPITKNIIPYYIKKP